jgi:DNA-binding MarR family transcriptional regulator
MKSFSKLLGAYNLSSTELTLLSFIQKTKQATVREIEMVFRMSRGSVVYTLDKLQERGLIARKQVGKKFIYTTSINTHTTAPIARVCTIPELFQYIRDAKHTRFYGVQSDGAIDILLVKLKELDSKQTISNIHRVQKQRSVIIESILSEESYRKIQSMSGDLQKSHHGRPSLIYVTKQVLPGVVDIYFDKSSLCIVNYKKMSGVIIEDKDIAEMLLTIFSVLKIATTKESAPLLSREP